MSASFLNASNHWSHIQAFLLKTDRRSSFSVDRCALETDHGLYAGRQSRSTPPADARKVSRSLDEAKAFLAEPSRPVMGYNTAPSNETFLDWLCGTQDEDDAATCICEQDDNCLLLYRHREGFFTLSPKVLAWLPDAVAKVEARCKAEFHYASVAADEQLAQDVTLSVDDPEAAAAEFWSDVDDDHVLYLDRTGTDGRWIESAIVVADDADEATVNGMRLDRDTNDYASRIRSHEMTKRRELFEAVIEAGLPLAEVAPWVKARIAIKRADAIKAKEKAEAATMWTEGFPLPSESQIRLRAYASCLEAVRRSGAQTKLKTWEPVVTTRYRDPKVYTGLTDRMRRQLQAA